MPALMCESDAATLQLAALGCGWDDVWLPLEERAAAAGAAPAVACEASGGQRRADADLDPPG